MSTRQTEALDRQLDTYGATARNRVHSESSASTDNASRWKRFAAATGATLAGVASAEGAIVHVVPQSLIRVEMQLGAPNADFQDVDIDGNGQDDMFIGAVSSFYSYLGGWRYNGSAQGLDGQMVFLGADGNIRKLANDTMIPAVAPTSVGAIIRTSATSAYSYGIARELGEWGQGDTGLAGFVLGTGASRRAGWIQFRTESFQNQFDIERMGALEVLQWAYESVPGVAIMAGQTTSVIVPGDYSGNGTVGPEDYALWKSTFGNTVTAGTGADGNNNGKVDAADYTVWRNNKTAGSGSLSSEAAVPEPTTISLGVLALGAAGVAALRRRAK